MLIHIEPWWLKPIGHFGSFRDCGVFVEARKSRPFFASQLNYLNRTGKFCASRKQTFFLVIRRGTSSHSFSMSLICK
jgi:hypothetical protein